MTTSPRIARDGQRPMTRRLNFTKTVLAGIVCPADKAEVSVYDTKARGLLYRIQRSGAKSFYWYGRVKGNHRMVKYHIGGDEFPVETSA